MRFSPGSTLFVALAVASASFGCSDEDERPAGIGDCEGVYCTNPGGGGSTTPTPDAGTDAATDADAGEDVQINVADVSGSIVRLADEGFSDPLPFTGWGYLRYPTPSGDEQVDFGADAGPGFSAAGVVTGDGWFTVVPDSALLDGGLVDVMPTYAYLRVPEGGATQFEIPVLDRTFLSILYAGFLQPTTVRGDAAQVVVVFERDGQRVPGVEIPSYPTAEMVAFDVGAGLSTEATATGNDGVALLVNVIGTSSLKWESGGGESGTLSVVHVPGQASFVRIEVP